MRKIKLKKIALDKKLNKNKFSFCDCVWLLSSSLHLFRLKYRKIPKKITMNKKILQRKNKTVPLHNSNFNCMIFDCFVWFTSDGYFFDDNSIKCVELCN